MRTTNGNRWAAVAAGVACVLVSGCSNQSSVRVDLNDRYPSTTATDWVTYADFAAVVEVAGDKSSDPSAEELERGEGAVSRSVNLRVVEVLWRGSDSKQPPAELDYAALGWQFRDGDLENLMPMVASDRPRLEVGGTYLMAFTWQPEVCYEGDGVIPAHWNSLGSGSVLPYENKAVGVGEFAGEQRDEESATEDAKELPSDALSALAVGRDAQFVAAMLTISRPGEAEDYGPTPSTC